MTTVIEQAKYIFNEEEIADISSDLARKLKEIERIEEQKKEVTAQLKQQIDTLNNEVRVHGAHIRNRYEYRAVECEVQYDYAEGIVNFVRTDTGEVHNTRAMTAAERQMSINDEGDA